MNYVTLDQIEPEDLRLILNKEGVRRHLVEHELFSPESFQVWLSEKRNMDLTAGCRVRAIVIDGQCIGWCGIQLTQDEYEISIVLDKRAWGLGLHVFRDLMTWAREFQHKFIVIHLLDSRPEYAFLKKKAKRIYKSEIFKQTFNTYLIEVTPQCELS